MRRLLVLTLLLLTAVAGCGSSEPSWHPVTTEESQQLAVTRFNNFDAGTRPLRTSITVSGAQLRIEGWVDFTTHLGYAAVTGESFEPQTMLWGPVDVALLPGHPGPQQPTEVVAPDGRTGWDIRRVDAGSSALDTLLVMILSLGSDRPENPLLLQQAGALWLSHDELENVDGTVSVFAAPPQEAALGPDDPQPTPETATVKLWLDEQSVMHRVEASIGGQWVTVDLGPATGVPMTLIGG